MTEYLIIYRTDLEVGNARYKGSLTDAVNKFKFEYPLSTILNIIKF